MATARTARSTRRVGDQTFHDKTQSEPTQSAADASDPHERARQIALRAYYRAERRGFTPGGELEDWLEAERELG